MTDQLAAPSLAPPSPASLRQRLAAFGVPGLAAAAVLLGLVVLALLAPELAGKAATEQDIAASYAAPSSEHLLGTDGLGRDVLARTLMGTRLSLALAAMSVLLAVVIGVPAGGLLALAAPRARRLGTAVIDTALSTPDVLIAVVLITIVGVGATGAVVAIGIAFVPYVARVTFALSASVAGRDFVAAGRVLGLSRRRLAGRYVLPNIADTLVVTMLAMFADCIVAVSALSFLGFGVQPPDVDWGSLLTAGVKDFYLSPAAALGPAVFIALTGLSLALLADAVARALNPATRRRPELGVAL